MARFPGTETPFNRGGWCARAVVRCRRSRANGSRGLADVRGLVIDVRPGHVQVLLEAGGRSVWIENDALVAEDDLQDPHLELLRTVFTGLNGQRLAFEEGHLVIYGDAYPVEALDAARTALGDRLVSCELAPQGVHELATRLVLRSDSWGR